jgi:Plasmid encoded RepA protein
MSLIAVNLSCPTGSIARLETEYWWSPKTAQSTLWPSWVDLGERFYEAITEAPVPADMRALRLLKRFPLAYAASGTKSQNLP